MARSAPPGRQDRVNVVRNLINRTSGAGNGVAVRCTLCGVTVVTGTARHRKGAPEMADLAYAVLLIGVFALLALMVRGLERL